jgi:hypothetical protein
LLSRRNNTKSPSEIAAARTAIAPAPVDQPPHYASYKPRKLTAEQQTRHDRVCELWRSGNGVREIMLAMTMPKSTVTWIINKNGLWGKGGRTAKYRGNA